MAERFDPAADPLDAATIAELRRLDRTVRPGVLKRIASTFAETSATLIASMAEDLRDGRRDALVAHAHSLKGSAASVGAMRLSTLAAELHAAALHGDVALLEGQVNAIASEQARVADALTAAADAP